VSRDDEPGRRARCTLEQGSEPQCVGVGQRLLHHQSGPTRSVRRKFADQSVVVEHEWCRERIAHATIGPSVDANEGGVVAERDDSGWRQPLNVRAALGECRCGVANTSDRGAVMVVIAEDVPDRALGGIGDIDKVSGEARRQ